MTDTMTKGMEYFFRTRRERRPYERARAKEYYAKNREKRLAQTKKWRNENMALSREIQKSWYVRNGKKHYQKNIERHREANRTTYAKKIGLTRSEIMTRVKSVSKLELSARRLATEVAGCRLRHQPRNVFGRPDYANKRLRVAVFIHGCWWHFCKLHGKVPKTNAAFWRRKFERNASRHVEVVARLKKDGWRTHVVWEHDVWRRVP